MAETLWSPLRKWGLKIIEESLRLKEEKQKLIPLLKKNSGVSLSLEAKQAIRDDVFDSFQQSDHKDAYQYAKENLVKLELYSNEELDWIREWKGVLISDVSDILDMTEGTTIDQYPKIQDFFSVSNKDWILFSIIRGEEPDDLYSTISFSDVLEQLAKVRRDQIKEKIRLGAKATIEAYISTTGRYPSSNKELLSCIPPELQPYQEQILITTKVKIMEYLVKKIYKENKDEADRGNLKFF